MNRREHLEPGHWKASYTKHKRAFLLISVFKRQKKTHFLKCSLEILCFEVVEEFRMWDKGETLAWSKDNSLFLQGLGLNCRECWHSAQTQLSRPQHLLEKVELETCALHSLLIISLPASAIVHVLWHSQSLHLHFAQDSIDKPDDECGKLLPEGVWLELHLKLLAKHSSVVFCCSVPSIRTVPFCRRLHNVEQRCSTYRWLIIRLAVLIAGLYQLLFWHYETQDAFNEQFALSPYLPLPFFFQQQRFACRHFKLNIIQARNCANHSLSPPCSVCRHCWQIWDVSPIYPSTHKFSQQMGEWGFSCPQRQHGVADRSGLWIRKYCKAFFVCWQRVSRPVFTYIHLSWLGMFKNVVDLH